MHFGIRTGFGAANLFPMNLLGAPTSRRPVGNCKPELAGETPALPGIAPRFRGSRREFVRGNLTPALSPVEAERENSRFSAALARSRQFMVKPVFRV